MKKIAVIDVGSNSVRCMMVADGKILYKTLETTRLGEGLALDKTLKMEAIERTAQAVVAFFRRANAENAQNVVAFATAAARSATNGNVFVKRVKTLCGLDVEVLSGEEEAQIGILGALRGKDGSIVDVGGASTEIITQRGGKIVYEKSVDVGVVRLQDGFGRDRERLQAYANEQVNAFGGVEWVTPIYLIGGTATTLGAVRAGLTQYDAEKVTGVTFSVDEIAQIPCVERKRADVLAGGALWLKTIARRFALQTLTVSDSDNLEGYAIKRGLMKI